MVDRPQHDAVSRDLADAFSATPVTRGAGLGSAIIVVGPASTPARRRAHWLTLAAPTIVAAMLIGLLGHSALGGRMSLMHPVAASVPLPGHSASSTTVAAPAARSGEARRVPEQEPALAALVAAPATLDIAAAPSSHTSTMVPPRPSQERAKQAAHAIDRDDQGRGADQGAKVASMQNGCAPNAQNDDCIYADVLLADRRLRAAYTQAVERGVPTVALTPAVRRWRQARVIARERPDEAIRLYGALAYDLDGYAADGAP